MSFPLDTNSEPRAYRNKLHTTQELKLSIHQVFLDEMLQSAIQNFDEKLRISIPHRDHHVTDIIFQA